MKLVFFDMGFLMDDKEINYTISNLFPLNLG